jgi:hypothetical protein
LATTGRGDHKVHKGHVVALAKKKPEDRAFYEIKRKNIIEPDRPLTTIGLMRTACWIPKGMSYVSLLYSNSG